MQLDQHSNGRICIDLLTGAILQSTWLKRVTSVADLNNYGQFAGVSVGLI